MIEKPLIIKNLISEDLRKYLSTSLKIYLRANKNNFDFSTNGDSYISSNSWTDALLITNLKKLREITKINLEPTYCFIRLYTKYSSLKEHTDRPSCEYSLTLFIDSCKKYDWPIKMNGEEYLLEPGDAVLYKGCEWKHSRKEFLGDYHFQCFLHFVNGDGPNARYKYDQRKTLGEPK